MYITYRPYLEKDQQSLQALLVELGYSVGGEGLVTNIREIKKRGGEIFVAESGDLLVGSICSIIDVRLAEGVYGEIVSLVVSKDYRGKGLGKKLIEMAEEWMKSKVGKIRVRANTIRSNAHIFYNKQGYREIKTQKIFIKEL